MPRRPPPSSGLPPEVQAAIAALELDDRRAATGQWRAALRASRG